MIRLIEFLNKNSKIILNTSIIFLCIVISVFLIFEKEAEEEQTENALKQQFETTISDISQRVSNLADKFFPVRPSLRSRNPLETTIPIESASISTGDELPEFDLKEFLNNPTVEKLFYKAVLTLLISYLVISYILRKR